MMVSIYLEIVLTESPFSPHSNAKLMLMQKSDKEKQCYAKLIVT